MNVATRFSTLNLVKRASVKPILTMMRPNLRAARRASASLLVPVTTSLPDLKTSAVDLGSRMRMITAAKRRGLYSALRAVSATCFRSSLHPRLAVATTLWITGIVAP